MPSREMLFLSEGAGGRTSRWGLMLSCPIHNRYLIFINCGFVIKRTCGFLRQRQERKLIKFNPSEERKTKISSSVLLR